MRQATLLCTLLFTILSTQTFGFSGPGGPGGPGGGDGSSSQGSGSGSGSDSDSDSDSDDGDSGGNNQEGSDGGNQDAGDEGNNNSQGSNSDEEDDEGNDQEGSEADDGDPVDDGTTTPLFYVLYAESTTEGAAYGWDRHMELDPNCEQWLCDEIEVWDEMTPMSYQSFESQGGLNGQHFTGIDAVGAARQESAYHRDWVGEDLVPTLFSEVQGHAWAIESYDTDLLVGVNLLAQSNAKGIAAWDFSAFGSIFEGFGWGTATTASQVIIEVNAPVRLTINRSSSSNGYQYSSWSQTVTRLEWNQAHTALNDVEVLFTTMLESSEYSTVHHGPTSDGPTYLELPEGVYKFECSSIASAVSTYDPNDGWDQEYYEGYEQLMARSWSDAAISLELTFELIPEDDDWHSTSEYDSADFNEDGEVNGMDMALILGGWGTDEEALDLSGNGIVDGADLSLVLGAWN